MTQAGTPGRWIRQVPSKILLALLVAMTAAAPVSLQIYLPALPAVQKSFGVETGVVQLTLSLSILANAVATLIYGPLSDRYGRRPVLIGGLVLFLFGSAMAIWAPTIETLILARVLLAAGAAAGMVLARAIVRDLYDREQAASAIAYLTLAMVVAPMLAPALGALLIEAFHWRSVFVALSAIALVLTLLVLFYLVETRDPGLADGGWRSLFRGFAHLLRQRMFLAYVVQSTFAMCTFFAFLAGAPYYMIDILGRPATEYALYFMLVSGMFMVGNLASARIVGRFGINRLILVGSALSLLGVSTGLALFAAGYWVPLSVFGPMTFAAFGNGLSIANAMAGSISIEPRLAGTASGLIGFAQMLFAAIVSQIVGVLQNGTPYPMIGFMFACATLSLLGYVLLAQLSRPADPEHGGST